MEFVAPVFLFAAKQKGEKQALSWFSLGVVFPFWRMFWRLRRGDTERRQR
jgi:hypothetical protein